MTIEAEKKFAKAINVRRCEKCCGNCRHFDSDYDGAECHHPRRAEFWDIEKYPGGITVDEGCICDYWEETKHYYYRYWEDPKKEEEVIDV